MKTVNYAIIGFGGIAENRLAKEGFALDKSRFEPVEGFQLVGATDVNSDRRSAVESLGLKWFDSAAAIFADSAIDAVVIATNNRTHAELGLTAMAASKHCFVEKPLATTVEDAKKLLAAASKYNVALSVDHMMTKNAYNREARELIRGGFLGDVNDLHLHMEFLYGATPEERATWRCAQPEELGGPIGDVGSHCFYMAEFLLDSEIESVSAVYHPKTFEMAVENGALINFTMKNGKSGSASVSFASPRGGAVGTLSNLGFEIYGSDAVCRSYGTMFQFSGYEDEPVNLRLIVDRGVEQETLNIPDPPNIYQEIIREHADAVRNGEAGNAASALRNIELMIKAHESAKGRVSR